MIKIEYPSIGITHTYIGMTPDEVDAIRDETEEDIRRRYGIGWDKGYKVLYDDTNTTMMKIEKEIEQKPILEVFGFKVGDAVRLKDGDGRKHIIKSFEEVKGIHGPDFYQVKFEDNSARDGIYPDEKCPNGYYTQMEKFEK